MMKRFGLISLLAIPFTSLAGPAVFEEARVISATPVYEQVSIERPSQHCWIEQVPVRVNRDHGVGLVVGGVLGGALGNAVGHSKRNKQVGAVVGSVLGATVGNAIAKNRANRGAMRSVENCQTIYHTDQEDRFLGYDVDYEFNGRNYRVRTQSDPGSVMQLRVTHTPVI